jgi:hypothetical protein
VSPWFPESVVLRLGDVSRAFAAPPSDVATLRTRVESAALATPAAADLTRLDAMLSAFERELDERASRRGTRVTCIVAGDAARYRIVPWSDELVGTAQRQVLAEHCFREAYGEAARGWEVRMHTGRHGAAALACALDMALLDRLDALVQARQLRLVSVQPSLMHAFNATSVPREPGPYWFVCIDALRATALLMSPGEPLHVKQLSTAGLDLALSLEREAFALGLEGPRFPIRATRFGVGAGALGSPLAEEAGWCSVDPQGLAAIPALERRAA